MAQRGDRRVGEVICSIDHSAPPLIPNLDVDVRVLARSEPHALLVPRAAVRTDRLQRYLFVVKDGVAHRRAIDVDGSSSTSYAITRGLTDGRVGRRAVQHGTSGRHARERRDAAGRVKIAVFFALDAECAPWRAGHRFQSLAGADGSLFETTLGQSRVRLALIGIGARRLDSITARALSGDTDVVIGAGVSGGLQD